MVDPIWKCDACGRDNFEGQRGLTQHQRQNALCKSRLVLLNSNKGQSNTANAGLLFSVVNSTAGSKRTSEGVIIGRPNSNKEHGLVQSKPVLNNLLRQPGQNFCSVTNQPAEEQDYCEDSDSYQAPNEGEEYLDDMSVNVELPLERLDRQRALMEDFRKYTSNASFNFIPFSATEKAAIKCMHVLRGTKAPLSAYKGIMEWHLKETKAISEHEKLGNTQSYLSQDRIFKKLRERYNMSPKYFNMVKRRQLPSSKSTVNIICNHAGALVRSILTDPRIHTKDYLFFDKNNPFAPPPANLDYIGDINTGLAYTETYRRLITDPSKQLLMMTPLYIDGCVTGAFSNLSITQLKMTCGFLNQEARDREDFWRVLGTVPTVEKAKSRGRRMMLASRHTDGIMAHQDVLEEEGTRQEGHAVSKLEDYHFILDVIMESLREIQHDNMIMDINYNGKLYKDIEVFFFVPHIKVDNEEADKLCAKYGSRTKGVAQLCRQCKCPTEFTARAGAQYPLKTATEIKGLIEDGESETLRAMSQHNFPNAFHKIRFGLHNDTGIHGACPIDMLHTIFLGIFMRVRDGFFSQTGESSQTTADLDALAMEYGELLARKSERDLPKTKFTTGITGGKLMAKEYEGVLLFLIAVLLHSTKGRAMILLKFKDEKLVEDWVLLVETLLGWIMWLKSKRLKRTHVKAAQWKHRYLMHLIKKLVRRTKGMGMRVPKFHLLQHISNDLNNNGNAGSLCTGSNETGHKPTKKAALLTQKKPETFDLQTATRLLEAHLLDLAMEEMSGRPLWEYLSGYDKKPENSPEDCDPVTKGAVFDVNFDEDTQEDAMYINNKTIDHNEMFVETDFVDFVTLLKEKLARFDGGTVQVRTEHKRNNAVFRAHTKYRGSVWRDWVEIDWGEADGKLPAKIWGFVDLEWLPQDNGVSFGGNDELYPAVYAIVESSDYSTNQTEIDMSHIFVPITKEVKKMTNGIVTKLKFYLAEVEAFAAPLAVVADIGGPTNAYFIVRSRECWREDFEGWLDNPIYEDTFTLSDDETDDEDIDPGESMEAKRRKEEERADKEFDEAHNSWALDSGDEAIIEQADDVILE